ncbi:hypothetical protein HQN88_07520 [Paenibacillus qinlingensis]|nr:hypothetical protein [Paenibacillus qinlingensis]
MSGKPGTAVSLVDVIRRDTAFLRNFKVFFQKDLVEGLRFFEIQYYNFNKVSWKYFTLEGETQT